MTTPLLSVDYATRFIRFKNTAGRCGIFRPLRRLSLAMSLTELAEAVDIIMANLSIFKTRKAKAIRFSTLEAICKHLGCQPGDILGYGEAPVPALLSKNSDSKELL